MATSSLFSTFKCNIFLIEIVPNATLKSSVSQFIAKEPEPGGGKGLRGFGSPTYTSVHNIGIQNGGRNFL